jgi:hypothetical protein
MNSIILIQLDQMAMVVDGPGGLQARRFMNRAIALPNADRMRVASVICRYGPNKWCVVRPALRDFQSEQQASRGSLRWRVVHAPPMPRAGRRARRLAV